VTGSAIDEVIDRLVEARFANFLFILDARNGVEKLFYSDHNRS
jgi:hypothetical protein